MLSLCVDEFIGTYAFTNVTTKIKFRAAGGTIDALTKRHLFFCDTYSFSTFSTPKVSCVFVLTLCILKMICYYWIKGGDASALQIWRGEGRPDKANKKTVVASTVIPPG